MHCNPIWSLDGAAGTIATIHVNLVMGTLAKFQHLPHVSQLLQKMLNFEVNGQYCLTELGHGLDVFALETRVNLTAEGNFRLNTPNPRAAKYYSSILSMKDHRINDSHRYMPPTNPCGYPVTAVVFA
jgi:acyl-CoA oxidase